MALPRLTDQRWSMPLAALTVVYAGVFIAKGEDILSWLRTTSPGGLDSEFILVSGWATWLLLANALPVTRDNFEGRMVTILTQCCSVAFVAYKLPSDQAGLFAVVSWTCLVVLYAFVIAFSPAETTRAHLNTIFFVATAMLVAGTSGEVLNVFYRANVGLQSYRLLSPSDANAFAAMLFAAIAVSHRDRADIDRAPWKIALRLSIPTGAFIFVLLPAWFDGGKYIVKLNVPAGPHARLAGTALYATYVLLLAVVLFIHVQSQGRRGREQAGVWPACVFVTVGALAGVLHGIATQLVRISFACEQNLLVQVFIIGAPSGAVGAVGIALAVALSRAFDALPRSFR